MVNLVAKEPVTAAEFAPWINWKTPDLEDVAADQIMRSGLAAILKQQDEKAD